MSLALLLASASFLFVPQAQAAPTGELWSWGANWSGELGLGDSELRNIPYQVGTKTNWTNVCGGDSFTIAINAAGELWAWGWNNHGKLGLGDDGPGTNRNVPTRVGTATNWIQVSGGANGSSFAINSAGELWAWGWNGQGNLGLGDSDNRNVPTQVGTATNWTQVSAAGNHTLALNSAGEIWAWGLNSQGQLGQGDFGAGTNRNTPIQMGTETNWTHVAAGASVSFAINEAGELWAWGSNGWGALGIGESNTSAFTSRRTYPHQVGTAANWTYICVRAVNVLALNSLGELWAWGSNTQGQLGINEPGDDAGNLQNRYYPHRVGTATNWTSVATGDANAFAVNSLGELWAWGWNVNGQLGLGDEGPSTNRPVPTRVGTDNNWISVLSSNRHALALRTPPLALTKHLQKPEGTPAPNLNFRFTFERNSFNGYSTPADIARIPVINPIILNPTTVVSPAPPPAGTVTLKDYTAILDGITFTERGVFSWIIREDATHPSGAGSDSSVVFSQASYELRAYVAQAGEGFHIRFITLHRLTDPVTGAALNPPQKVDELIFVNQYTYDPFVTPTGLFLRSGSPYLVLLATGILTTAYFSVRARKRIEELPIMH